MDAKAVCQPYSGEEEDASAEIQDPSVSPGRSPWLAEGNPGGSLRRPWQATAVFIGLVSVIPTFFPVIFSGRIAGFFFCPVSGFSEE
jgi:hypothetical protein